MQRALLLGSDHTDLGKTALANLGTAAVALSRGRHPKAYHYVDPNEDAVVAAVGDDFALLAVADGHGGTLASHAVANAIHQLAPSLLGLDSEAAVAAVSETAAETLSRLLPGPPDEPAPATTLSVVVVAGDHGAATGWGDSVAVRLHGGRARQLTSRTNDFRYAGAPSEPTRAPVSFRFRPGDSLLVATDGLVDFLARPWETGVARLIGVSPVTPNRGVESLVEAAGDGGGGDNVAVGLCAFPGS